MFAAILFGLISVNTTAQVYDQVGADVWGQTIKVVNDAELIEGLDNPNVQTILLSQGYYKYLDFDVLSTGFTKVIKAQNNTRNECQYFITVTQECWPNPVVITAGTHAGGTNCPPDDSGIWSVIGPGVVTWDPDGPDYNQVVVADQPGEYVFRYDWPSTNFWVQGTVFWWDFEVEAGDDDEICGLSYALTPFISPVIPDPENPPSGIWSMISGPGDADFDGNDVEVTECGEYVFEYTVKVGACEKSSQVTINFYDDPVIDMQDDAEVCLEDLPYVIDVTFAVDCDYPAVATWQVPDGVVMDGNKVVSVDLCGEYTFIYDVVNGPCSATASVTLSFFDKPQVFVPQDDEICGLEYNLWGSYEVSCEHKDLTEEWEMVSGPGDAVFTSIIEYTKVTVTECGEYVFAYTVTNGFDACGSTATVTINFYDEPVIDMQDDAEVCLEDLPYDIDVTFAVDCDYPAVATWQVPDGVVMDGNQVVSVEECGEYTFIYDVVNGPCSSTASITLSFFDKPQVFVQEDDEICGLEYVLEGSYEVSCAHEDFTAEWSMVSGPGTVTITLNQVEVSECGEYVFAYTAYNGFNTCEASENVTINFYDVPVIDMQDNDEVCLEDLPYDLTASFTVGCDYPAITTWTLFDGPGSVELDGNSITSVEYCGIYTFEYFVQNGPCEASTTVQIAFYDKPQVFVQEDDEICGLEYVLEGSFEVSCTHEDFTAGWSLVGGPGDAEFVENIVTVTECGEYEFAYTVNNGFAACEAVSTVIINFYDVPVIDMQDDAEVCLEDLPYDIDVTFAVACDYPATATWQVPAGVVMDGNQVVSVEECGEYTFIYDVDNGPCSATASVTLSFFDKPEISVQEDDEICGLEYDLVGTYTVTCEHPDLTAEWSLVSGPGTATITLNHVEVSECGEYVFAYTVNNGFAACEASENVTINFYDTPEVDAGPDQEVCGLETNLEGSFTVDCEHPDLKAYWGYKTPAPGDVVFEDPYDPNTKVTVTACGEYTFVYTVENGPCGPVTDFMIVNFYDEAEIIVEAPEDVCGYETTVYVAYEVECPYEVTIKDFDYTGPGTAEITEGVASDTYNISVDTCGEYEFTYTVTNGPCVTATTFVINFFELPAVEISGPDPMLCRETEYELVDLRVCSTEPYTIHWSVVGGDIVGTDTGTTVTVSWYDQSAQLSVVVCYEDLPDCCTSTFIDVEPAIPTIEGQIKYWNEFETYMPTPYPTFDYATYPHDYFYVELWNGEDFLEVVAAQPRLKEDLIELISHFEFSLDDYFADFGCDGYWLKVWDGGLVYHYAFPGGSGINPPQAAEHLGANYTYKNWGGVNATDALIVDQMAVGAEVNPPVLGVGSTASTPMYGYYSHSVADVNSSNRYVTGGITALDALTINYRALGLIGMFPNNSGAAVQYSPNFMVTGRMVPELPYETWPLPFDYEFDAAGNPIAVLPSNPDDLPFFHSGESYLYFTNATDHKYSSVPFDLYDKNYINIYYQALGDINSSFVPPSYPFPFYPKADETIALAYVGEQVVSKGEVVTVPISIDRSAILKAISLDLTYNTSLIEVIGVNHAEDFVNIDAEKGILRINWWNTEGADFASGDALALVQVRVLSDISADVRFLELSYNTELAGSDNQTVKNITLETTALSIVSDELFITNYPNPFTSTTNISYNLPEDGNVTLVVYNKLGQIVETLVSARQEAGTHKVEFGRSDLTPGVYFYKIVVEGESNSHTSTNSMIFMK